VLVAPDVSEFQVGLNSTYPRDTLIFRCCDGDSYQDAKFLHNSAEVAALHKAGRLHCAVAYQVYRPVSVSAQYAYFWKLMGPVVPPWLTGIMIDAESWGGQIRGDHSAALNQLYGMHAHKMGHFSAVLGYGNRGDLATLWPTRDARCKVIVADYSSTIIVSQVRGAIGQQYYGGVPNPVPRGLPTSTAPFGNCDHNVFPAFTNGTALANYLRPTAVVKPPVVVVKPPYLYPTTLPLAVRSVDRNYALEISDTGSIQVHKNGVTVRSL
jgi:hypothetical protein